MGPLEAARKILDEGPLLGQTSDDYRSWYTCVFCVAEQEWADDFPHKPDCPWKQMPKIVAALEAATLVILDLPETSVFIGFGADRHCRFCTRTTYRDGEWRGTSHETDCPWQAAKNALKGKPA